MAGEGTERGDEAARRAQTTLWKERADWEEHAGDEAAARGMSGTPPE